MKELQSSQYQLPNNLKEFNLITSETIFRPSKKIEMTRIQPAFLAIVSLFTFAFAFTSNALAQIEDPTSWEVNLYENGQENSLDIVFHVTIDSCWSIYSQNQNPDEGPTPTFFEFDIPGAERHISIIEECKPGVKYDPNFMMDLMYFDEEAYFWTTLDVSAATESDTIIGFLNHMTCNYTMCLPPTYVDFKVAISDALPASEKPNLCPEKKHICQHGKENHNDDSEHGEDSEKNGEEGLIWIFLMGFGLGFAALLTPCVFPMIPMTVSFFTKTSKTKAAGIRNALTYGFFIIFIYTGLGLALTAIFGVDVMNVISTDPYFNIGLFLLLIVFGASFLGAFEIQLPQSWANKADAASDKGGLIGIFFMAATLAIVSFSCTGPLIGGALAGAATGSYAAPAAVMLGFSIALSLPFMFFSAFPGYLNALPSSGGWLNTVKVVLGLIEIGFAFKFLSNADLVLQLGLLQRELFIAIWVAVCIAIAIYLFGWLTLPHDSKVERISVTRFGIGMVFFTIGIYLLPGMWGAPVNLISGFPPPTFYSEWSGLNAGGGSSDGHSGGHIEAQYHDYEEGMAAAKEQGKPVLLDFTGWACVNCRKMEEQVWPDSEVSRILTEEVVLVSLYVDERTKLPEDEQRKEEYGGKEFNIRTIGNKWSYLQASKFNRNAQPFYVMVDHDGNQVGGSAGYDSDPQLFIDYLHDALKKFKH